MAALVLNRERVIFIMTTTIQLLEERAEAYISGKEKSLSWEEVEELAKKKLAEQKNEKK